jgi:hypothetical protein
MYAYFPGGIKERSKSKASASSTSSRAKTSRSRESMNLAISSITLGVRGLCSSHHSPVAGLRSVKNSKFHVPIWTDGV